VVVGGFASVVVVGPVVVGPLVVVGSVVVVVASVVVVVGMVVVVGAVVGGVVVVVGPVTGGWVLVTAKAETASALVVVPAVAGGWPLTGPAVVVGPLRARGPVAGAVQLSLLADRVPAGPAGVFPAEGWRLPVVRSRRDPVEPAQQRHNQDGDDGE
jgi:hypothetical protein